MTRKFLCSLSLIGVLAKPLAAQWQAVTSPADRVFAFIQTDARIFAGSENSGLFMSTNNGASFSVHPTGLLEMNFDIRSFERSNDTLWAGIFGGGVCRSTDGGSTWQSFNTGFQTQSFVVGVKQIGDTVYAAVDFFPGLQPSGVYKTSVNAAHWTRAGAGYPQGLANTTSFASTASGAMFVGAGLAGARGNIQASIDNGHTWLNRNITGVAEVITLESKNEAVYAGTSIGIFVTHDYGASWARLGAQFQTNVIDDILFFEGKLFAAVDGVGVAVSANEGATWEILTGNLPIDNDFVSALFISGGKIFAGLSAARGIWSRPLPATGVGENKPQPHTITLAQNYPNPFSRKHGARTAVSFTLSKAETVTLRVYDVLGNEVATLLRNEKRPAGNNTVSFDAGHLASGYYFYRLTAGDFTGTKKMLLTK